MKKVYLLKGLDCPNCAAKIEKEAGGLKGVREATVNLMNQTLTVTADDSPGRNLIEEIEKIVHNHEPEVRVSEYSSDASKAKKEEDDGTKKTVIRLIAGAVVFGAGIVSGKIFGASFPLQLGIYITAYIILGIDVLIKAVRNIVKGSVFDENFLMGLSTIGAFIIGEYPEAVAVMLFYQVGEFFQDLSVQRSRKSISRLMDIRPDSATVKRKGEMTVISPEEVNIGEIIVVKPGEKIPLDGVVVQGEAMLDTTALTGESVPRSVKKDDSALSGCINQSGLIEIRVTKAYGESTVAKIIDLVENASSRKAPTESFITKFAKYYTPAVVILAAMLAVIPPIICGGSWTEWIHRSLVFLVISCPCALVISIPLAFFGGIGAASRHGILVKGGNFLEALNNIGTVVFDKTGTLTKGVFKVSEILPEKGFREDEILEYAAYAEAFSNHPIGKSILSAYGREADTESIEDYKELSSRGISATVRSKKVLAGSGRLLDSANVEYTPCNKIGTKVYLAIDGKYAGCILIADEIKADSKNAIARLKRMGIKKTVMLTGDDGKIASAVAEELNIDEYKAELLPHQKVEQLEILDGSKPKGSKLVFVGDGINDAPVLARADVGIAMGGLGSDAAIEAADVVIMTDEPSKLPEAIMLAKATKSIVIQNIVFALGIKAVFLILGAFGIAGMWEAVFGDVGVALIAVFNSMRVLKK